MIAQQLLQRHHPKIQEHLREDLVLQKQVVKSLRQWHQYNPVQLSIDLLALQTDFKRKTWLPFPVIPLLRWSEHL